MEIPRRETTLSLWRPFLLIGVPAAVLVWTLFYLPGRKLRGQYRAHVADRQTSLIQDEKEILEAGLDPPFGSVRYLSALLEEAMSHPPKPAGSGPMREIAEWLKDNPDYRSVAFLDARGRETLRIGATGAALSVSALRENEDYFRMGMRCRRGQTFVSGLRRDTDSGSRVSDPILHYATPVFSAGGARLGLAVLTLSARDLLARLTDDGPEQRVFLANPAGYWLLGPAPEDEWRFQPPMDASKTMARMFPEEWARMAAAPAGQVTTKNGLFTYATIDPLADGAKNEKPEAGIAGEKWLMVSWVRARQLDPKWGGSPTLGGFLASLLTLAIVWQWARARGLRERTAARLRMANAELERRVEERTSDLRDLSEELRGAKEIAEAAARAKSAFLATMSHEIRTPLNAIIGFGDLMRRTELSAKQRDYLGKVQSSSSSLLGIVNDVLDFSKIEAGKLGIETTDFRPGEVLEKVASLLGGRAQEKSLELAFTLDPAIPHLLRGDPHRLEQILINLVGNAVKFTERGEIAVSASLREADGQGVSLLFTVRDHGIGISPEQRSRLFQTFSQADTSTTRKFGGTGLGLAICKQLAELMGGSIWVESEPGKGSTFGFTLPFGRAPEASPSWTPSSHPPPSLDSLRGARVLLAEDNELNRQLAKELLEAEGLTVTLAGNGLEALEKAAAGGFDVILMDIQMPEMDGLTAARMIRGRPGCGAVPILAMTANVLDSERAAYLEAGMNDFIAKPIDVAAMHDTLLKWVPPRDAGAPAVRMREEASSGFDLPGIDSAAALRRLNGNADLYRRLLLKFRERCRNAAGEIGAALDAEDLESAELAAHTLKGLAATIGADALAEAARTLEASLKNKDGRARTHLPPLTRSLDAVHAALLPIPGEAAHPAPRAAGSAKPADAEEWSALRAMADALRGRLARSEAGAAAGFRQLSARLEGLGVDAGLSSLGQAVAEYDFETAGKALEALCGELERIRKEEGL